MPLQHDPAKAAANLKDHAVSFADAEGVLSDPLAVTVEDPDVLLQPFKMNTRMMRINPNPRAYMTEGLPCSEKDLSHLVSKENH